MTFAEDPVVILDVYENLNQKRILAAREVTAMEARGELFQLDFSARKGDRVECRVYWREQCYLQITGVRLYEMGQYRDGPGEP